MALDPWRSWIGTAHARWTALERDWRSVAVAAVIVAVVGQLGVRVPW